MDILIGLGVLFLVMFGGFCICDFLIIFTYTDLTPEEIERIYSSSQYYRYLDSENYY